MEPDRPFLNDPLTPPDAGVLSGVLKDAYAAYQELITNILPENRLAHEWRYYKDGKSWLCKVTRGKKTVFWLSVRDGYFKTSFYFTEKNAEGIAGLFISDSIKTRFRDSLSVGKLKPLTLNVASTTDLPPVRQVLQYKMETL